MRQNMEEETVRREEKKIERKKGELGRFNC